MAAPTLVTGVLTGGSNSHQTTSEEVNAVATDFVSEGIVGSYTNTSGVSPATGAFAINASGSPDTNINISTGVAYVTVTPTSQNSQSLRVKCSVTGTLAISSNSSGSTKYDWIYISVSAANAANPNTAADNVATIVASRSSSASTDDGTPPTYGYPIAVVTVANGFSTITNSNIRDVRSNAAISSGATSSSNGWLDLGVNPNTVTYNGNRNYSLVFNSTDLTSTLSAGMRLRATRLVAAPTQCTSLNGTNQYWSKATPSGISFTDDFATGWWVKPTSYALGTIASIYNGTSGWALRMNANGQIQLIGYNASSANFSQVLSYQSLPLNKWTHVSAQLDMSAFTATTTTSYVMLDGVDVPAAVSRGGTNPTALVQAGNLNVGAENGGTNPFPGKIAQGGIFSAKVTQATMQGYISQTLSGAETSNVGTFTFNGSGNDSSSNANNLTAQNSATATNADSPFGGQASGSVSATLDYAEIVSVSFSTNTTVNVRVPNINAIPTTGGVSAVSYSTQSSPYGWPGISNILNVAYLNATFTTNATSATQVTGLSCPVTVPLGRQLEVTAFAPNCTTTSGAADILDMSIWDGTVGSGTQITEGHVTALSSGYTNFDIWAVATITPASASKTYNIGFFGSAAANHSVNGATTRPAYVMVKVV
jgi:hypothetical protein